MKSYAHGSFSRRSIWHARCVVWVFLAAMLLPTVAGANNGGEEPARNPSPDRKVVYKTVGDVELALHVFEPARRDAEEARPAAVFFFGGGWVGGTPKQFYPQCRYLASRGMWAAAAEYRVRSRHGTSPFECVEDGRSAVCWIRTHARDLGVDPERIAAGGGSAGGHVAACTGTILGSDCDEKSRQCSLPDALILFNPVVDTNLGKRLRDRFEGRHEEISPIAHVDGDVPPAIIFHGTGDRTVPIESVRRFARKMKAAGNRCELIEFDGAGHGFFNWGRGDGSAYVKTVAAMDRFLASCGFLEGEPTINRTMQTKESQR